MVLTEAGRLAHGYAERIFGVGADLERAFGAPGHSAPPGLSVGVLDGIPKIVAARLLEPALRAAPGISLVVREGPLPALLDALAAGELDAVLADAPGAGRLPVHGHSHLLGECGISFFGAGRLASLRRGFPQSLDARPVLLPAGGTALRSALDGWFVASGIRPVVAGEFDDSALLVEFGAREAGVFAAPTVIEPEIRRLTGARLLGKTDAVRDRFYAVTVARRIRHPAVAALTSAARSLLFQS
jgi:LysR family transcriptional activator of nhaA